MHSGPVFRRALTAALLLAGLTACTSSSGTKDVTNAARAFLASLGRGDAESAGTNTTDPTPAKAAITASLAGLGTGAHATFAVTSVSKQGTQQMAHYTATWTLPGVDVPWTYAGTLLMAKTSISKANGGWTVSWEPQDVQPSLTAGRHLVAVRTQPARAALQDDAGQSLFAPTPVVDVTMVPAQITDLAGEAAALASALGISAADIVAAVKATPTGGSTSVITLRLPDYLKVKARIYDLPGVQFPTRTEQLAPTRQFGQPMLGTVGPATKEIIDGSKGAIVAGDSTGLSGLQRAFNTQLSGRPGVTILAASADPSVSPVKVSAVSTAKPGLPVRLTLNRIDQNAADAALADVALPAAIVVTQPSTGKVLAVANSASAVGDIAVDGQFPPGSTFKIATYAAAFAADPKRTPATTAPCPGTMTVNGQVVHNENSFAKGTVSLASAFAFSCNTTAAATGLTLPSGALVRAAGSLGLGQDWSAFPVDAFSGSLPEPTTQNELAAASYGQGKVLVSPLLMAEMAGAAASGKSVVPSIVQGKQARPVLAQSPVITGYLNTMMRGVVTEAGATGSLLATVRGSVEGKTGTAEFGTDKPPKSHSWFAGTRGDLAFSVFVFGGENSSSEAVPLAKKLLTAIN
jgi:cell division protein FtsI/penicillin-binding protein 2